jgi:hypothetical protein
MTQNQVCPTHGLLLVARMELGAEDDPVSGVPVLVLACPKCDYEETSAPTS